MREKLNKLKARYEELGRLLSSPDAMADMDAWKELNRERVQLEEIVAVIDRYEKNLSEQADCREMLEEHLDADMKELTLLELDELKAAEEQLTEELKLLLLPKDPNDEKDVILEIRAGTGGEEASLFGGDLLRMYQRYAERHRYAVEFVEDNRTEMGGVKEVVLTVSGKGAYSRLKFESGVHRVQRVPETESQGRIHTSAATVAVMPQVDEVQVEIKDSDIQIDTYRSSGAGGQHVNKTSSAIRTPSASPTSPRASWWPARTSGASIRTRTRPCRCCGPGSTTCTSPSRTPPCPARERAWWGPGIGASGYGPITSPRTGSRTTGST